MPLLPEVRPEVGLDGISSRLKGLDRAEVFVILQPAAYRASKFEVAKRNSEESNEVDDELHIGTYIFTRRWTTQERPHETLETTPETTRCKKGLQPKP